VITRTALPAITVAIALVTVLSSGAQAHDHKTPSISLRSAAGVQQGALRFSSWSYPSGPRCVTQDSTGTGEFPPAQQVERGRQLIRFRFHYQRKPRRVVISIARPRSSEESAPARRVNVRLVPGRRDGKVRSWRAIWRPRLRGEYLIEAYAKWRDIEGCGAQEYVSYRFHLQAG